MLFDSLLRATTLSTSSLFILVSFPFYWLISCRTIRQWTKSLLHPHTRRRVSSHSGILRFVKIESFLLEDSLFCLCWNHSISLWRLLRSSKYSMSVQCHSVEHSKISESISSSLHISKEFNNVFDIIKSLLLILQNEELFTCLIPFYNEDSTPSLASSIRSLTEWIYTILHLNQLTTVLHPLWWYWLTLGFNQYILLCPALLWCSLFLPLPFSCGHSRGDSPSVSTIHSASYSSLLNKYNVYPQGHLCSSFKRRIILKPHPQAFLLSFHSAVLWCPTHNVVYWKEYIVISSIISARRWFPHEHLFIPCHLSSFI